MTTNTHIMDFVDSLSFPTPKTERWKYTRTKKFEELITQHPDVLVNQDEVNLEQRDFEQFVMPCLKRDMLVFVNGRFNKDLSCRLDHSDQVIIGSIADIQKSHPELISKHRHRLTSQKDAFTKMATELETDGACIYIPKSTQLVQPIQIIHISDARVAPAISQLSHLIILESGAQAKIVEEYHSLETSLDGALVNQHFSNVISEVFVGKDAIFRYYKSTDSSNHALHVGSTHIDQAAGSSVTTTTVSLGGSIIRNNLYPTQNGENAETNMYGLYVLHGENQVDNEVIMNHLAPHGESSQKYRGVLGGKATGTFGGKIYIEKDAQKIEANQSNKNLLLSLGARVNTKPQLEIYADDVSCSHGATSGQIDENQLFYLRSRGLSEVEARSLLTYAFAHEVLDHITFTPLKTHIDQELLKGIHDIF